MEQERSTEQAGMLAPMSSSSKVTPSSSELDRCMDYLSNQDILLANLSAKLDPVSHRTPEEQPKEVRDKSYHIADIAYTISQNNKTIAKMIDQLAV